MRFLKNKFDYQNAVFGESLVLAGSKPEALLQTRIVPGSITVRLTYMALDQGAIFYEEGRDYTVDYNNGTLTRTADSRIPDYSEHVFYGKNKFDHNTSPDFLNARFLVYCDYAFARDEKPVLFFPPGDRLFPIDAGKKQMTIGIIGDSITAGCNATVTERSYAWLWATEIARRYPGISFSVCNKAIGGTTSEWGNRVFERDLVPLKPDIVLIGFGMNDQNGTSSGGITTPPEKFLNNIETMCALAKKSNPGVLVVLVSPMLPNPRWRHTSGRLPELRAILRDIAGKHGHAFADVTAFWEKMLARKSFESLAYNNVNHPTDFGHYIYARIVTAATVGN